MDQGGALWKRGAARDDLFLHFLSGQGQARWPHILTPKQCLLLSRSATLPGTSLIHSNGRLRWAWVLGHVVGDAGVDGLQESIQGPG